MKTIYKKILSLFIEDGDKKVWKKFTEKIPKDTFKPWQVTKKIIKLPLHFIFDGFKIHRSFDKLKVLRVIGFFKSPINRIYNIVFHRVKKLNKQQKILVKKSIEEMDQELRASTIRRAQNFAIFFICLIIVILFLTFLVLQVSSIVVYINIGVSCFLLLLLVIGRLKDAYLMKYAKFNKTDIFSGLFWSLSRK